MVMIVFADTKVVASNIWINRLHCELDIEKNILEVKIYFKIKTFFYPLENGRVMI